MVKERQTSNHQTMQMTVTLPISHVKATWIIARFSKHTDTGRARVVSGVRRLENHRAPSLPICGHSTGSSATTISTTCRRFHCETPAQTCITCRKHVRVWYQIIIICTSKILSLLFCCKTNEASDLMSYDESSRVSETFDGWSPNLRMLAALKHDKLIQQTTLTSHLAVAVL